MKHINGIIADSIEIFFSDRSFAFWLAFSSRICSNNNMDLIPSGVGLNL